MAAPGRRPKARAKGGYVQATQRPLNCLFFVLPLLLFYQIGVGAYGSVLLAPRHLQRVLTYFGAGVSLLPPALILAALFFQHLFRKDPWTIQPRVLAGMFGESVAWTVPLIALAWLLGHIGGASGAAAGGGPAFRNVVVMVGAGVYEEFIFRLVLIGLVGLVFVDVLTLPEHPTTAAAVVVSAVLFAVYHPEVSGASWGTVPWGRLFFLSAQGVLWGVLYVFRGFAVAVGSHVTWNLYALAVQ